MTPPTTRPTSVIALVLAALSAAAPLSAQDGDAGDHPSSVLEGVFTPDQASDGENLYQQECALCHTTAEFTGRLFEIAWTNRSVHDLYANIATTMPYDRPGSLSGEQYAAIVAYILEMNGYPTGEEALSSEEEVLSGIEIEAPPDGSP